MSRKGGGLCAYSATYHKCNVQPTARLSGACPIQMNGDATDMPLPPGGLKHLYNQNSCQKKSTWQPPDPSWSRVLHRFAETAVAVKI